MIWNTEGMWQGYTAESDFAKSADLEKEKDELAELREENRAVLAEIAASAQKEIDSWRRWNG